MAKRSVERREDMSPDGVLRIRQQSDGDIIVACERSNYENMTLEICSVEFCATGAGGGRSPRVLQALIALMDAIELDNLERPIPA